MALITDTDVAPGEPEPARLQSLRELPRRWGSPGALHLAAAPRTLEPALWPENSITALRAAFLRCAPRSKKRWEQVVQADDPALAFGELFVPKAGRTVTGTDGELAAGTPVSKGEFAQELADVPGDRAMPFTVPICLADAIRFITASDASTPAVGAP
ncbi:hypothetical protein ACFV2X_46435 [Streptomyces sp. NPDC059679]|uniref:hypothetical protein n=1 Tax=Streptomyces sp. NPDC059679 TaxID=3346903 RepID=UPI00369617AA